MCKRERIKRELQGRSEPYSPLWVLIPGEENLCLKLLYSKGPTSQVAPYRYALRMDSTDTLALAVGPKPEFLSMDVDFSLKSTFAT